MTGGGGSSQPATTTQKTEPWDEQKPYLVSGFENISNQFLNSDDLIKPDALPEYYPGSTVVPFAPETEMALGLTTQRAINGSPVQRAGTQQIADTLSGKYLSNTNPFLDTVISSSTRPIIEQYMQEVAPSIDESFNSQGRFGSGLYAQARNRADDTLARNLTETAGKIGYQNYADERENILSAAEFAPAIAEQDYKDLNVLAGVGATREALANEYLQDDINRYNYDENRDLNALTQYMNLIQGNYGGTTIGTQAQGRSGSSPLMGALSGAAAGAPMGPWGMAAGGVLGLLGSR